MQRESWLQYINERLSTLAVRIKTNGKLNILSLNQHSENFYRDLLNIIFNYDLINLNSIAVNAEAIDLKDEDRKIVIQVTSKDKKEKIDLTLNKKLETHKNCTLYFLFIASTDTKLKDKSYKIDNDSVIFDPKNNIYDLSDILKQVSNLQIDVLKKTYELVRKELGSEPDIIKLDSNLAEIISILSAENITEDNTPEIDAFEIDRKIEFNNLEEVEDLLLDNIKYHTHVDSKYNEYDKQGANKSRSVLSSIQTTYYKCQTANVDKADLIIMLIDELKKQDT